jgi:hypothetical protein
MDMVFFLCVDVLCAVSRLAGVRGRRGLYACLTVCVPLIPYPQHLIQKHRDYLAAAKKAARPVFYAAFFSAVFAGVLAVYGFHAAAAFPAAVSVTAFITGWLRRRELISRFRSQ